jgi:hypothetical protein
MSNPYHMWAYWRDKKGLHDAIDDYYPEMKDDLRMRRALAQIETGVRAINALMAELAEHEVSSDNEGRP